MEGRRMDNASMVTGTASEDVLTLIRLVSDPKACEARVRELTKVQEATAAAEKKFAAGSEVTRQELADLERQKGALRDREVKIAQGEAALLQRHHELVEMARKINDRDSQERRRVLTLMGLDHEIGPLQDLPSWVELDRRIGTADPHFGNTPAAEMTLTEVEHAPAGSTLRRATPVTRRSRLEHEPRLQGDGGRQ
jgi:hypothetical protein